MSSVCHTCGVTEDNFSRRSCFDKHVKLHDNSSPSFCDSCRKITNEEQRYFKMMKYVKNQDKCDKTIFNSKKKVVKRAN